MKLCEDRQALEICFGTIGEAATRGDRCPVNGICGVHTPLTNALAMAGMIRVEISGQNYRTIFILDGEHAGKNTKAGPGRVWKVIDKDGTRLVGPRHDERAQHTKRARPSAPKLIGDWDYRV